MVTLNSIPFHIYLNNIIPNLDIKDVGNMSMTSKYLKEVCDSNEIWKFLYVKTNPLKILDTSIHIGKHTEYQNLSKSELLKKFKEIPPMYWFHNSTIHCEDYYHTGCCDNFSNSLRTFGSLYPNIRLDGPDYSSMKCVPENFKTDYYNICRDIHFNCNKEQGIVCKNLCTNTDHYIRETLGNYDSGINYKSFKKMTIKKILTQKKIELSKTHKLLDKQRKAYFKSLNETQTLDNKLKNSEVKYKRLRRFCDNSNLFLKSLE